MYECIIVHSPFFFSNFFNAVASYFFVNKFTDEINTLSEGYGLESF